LADGGYDVSDFRDIHPMFGTLGDADAVLRARNLGLQVIIDVVPSHLERAPLVHRSPRRRARIARAVALLLPRWRGRERRRTAEQLDQLLRPRYTAQPGSGRRARRPGQWYLHVRCGQPDLDWRSPDVLEGFDEILRFWFSKGVDGSG
jgi:alpha-glucosidase